MFTRKKKLESPAMMSFAEIESDLDSFSNQQSSNILFSPTNKQLINEILDEKEDNLQISSWWKLFKVFQNQLREIEEKAAKIDESKIVINSQLDELKEKRELLKNEIDVNYHKVLKLKTPE